MPYPLYINTANARKIGAQWVSNYQRARSNFGDLPHSQSNVEQFYHLLDGAKTFIHGNENAFDEYIEQNFPGAPPGANIHDPVTFGQDGEHAEQVDILYFCGHGTESALLYGVPDRDDGQADYREIQLGQGGRLKWFVADSCYTLQEPGALRRWRRIFQGLRYMFGFSTRSNSRHNRGWQFADQLNRGNTLREAWIFACEETEPDDIEWAYIHAGPAGEAALTGDCWHDDPLPAYAMKSASDATFVKKVMPS